MSVFKILVVAEEAIDAMDIKRTVESFGYSVPCVVGSVKEAVAKALDLMPDLVLIDIFLKGEIDGIKAAGTFKDLNIPVIFLTAPHSEGSIVKEAKLTEPYGYITKPYDVLELKFVIELSLYKHQQEKLLKESEKRYQNVIKYMKSGVAVYEAVDQGKDFVFKELNKAGQLIDQVKKKDIIGKRVTTVFPNVTDFGLLEIFKRVYKTGNPEHFPISLYEDDRISGWRDNFVYKLPSNEIVAVYEDLTESKQAEEALKESETLYHALFENSQVCTAITNMDGKVITANNSFFAMTGYNPEEIHMINLRTMYRDSNQRNELIEILKKQGNLREYNVEMIRRDGQPYSALINVDLIDYKKQDVMFVTAVDITERKLAEKALIQSEKLLEEKLYAIERIQKLGNLFLHKDDMEQVFTEIVDTAIAICGADFGNIQLLDHTDSLNIVVQRNFPQWWVDFWQQVSEGQGVCGTALELGKRVIVEDVEKSPIFQGNPALEMQLKAGVRSVLSTPIISRSGKPLGMFSTHYKKPYKPKTSELQLLDILAQQTADIIDKLRYDVELKESEEFLDNIVENIPNMIFVKNAEDLSLKKVNRAGEVYFGHANYELIGKTDYDFFSKEEADFFTKKDREVLQSGEIIDIPEETIENRSLGQRILHTKKIPIFDHEGFPQYLLGISEDITELKQAENELKNVLIEKETLLREIHHRVKNNMQIISSLLNLQKSYVEDNEADNVLMESQNRVKSMAMIHEKLYQSEDLATINLSDYIKKLVADLFFTYSTPTDQVTLVIEADDLVLNIETAIPCGLIITELVSNSLKYAFPKGRKGNINISLRIVDPQWNELIIADDGIGLPDGFDFKKTETLGLQLVNSLVNQLDGEITLEKSHGTRFKIRFRELTYKERV